MSKEQWDEFCKEYPLEANTRSAWYEWDTVPPFERDKVLKGLRRWKRSDDWKDPRYIPKAENFLKREIWKQSPRSEQSISKVRPFNPDKEEQPLGRDELFRVRHINTAGGYHYYQRAQRPENYEYKKRG